MIWGELQATAGSRPAVPGTIGLVDLARRSAGLGCLAFSSFLDRHFKLAIRLPTLILASRVGGLQLLSLLFAFVVSRFIRRHGIGRFGLH